MSTRSISAGGGNISTVRQALQSLGLLNTRFGWGELPEQGIALVSGPPHYVALVERTMAQLPQMAGGQQVSVFRLKHASVDDRTAPLKVMSVPLIVVVGWLLALVWFRTTVPL